MSGMLLSAIEYGEYISLIKFIPLVVLFLGWMPIIKWVYNDAEEVETNEVVWTSVIFATWAGCFILWLLIPVYIVGLVLYLMVNGISALAYIKHRNSLVLEYERILTPSHIIGLLSPSQKDKLESVKDFAFVTANGNDVHMPRPKTEEFFGYKAAYDLFSDAISKRAEIIVINPSQHEFSMKYLIDGTPVTQPSIDKESAGFVFDFLKELADLDAQERRKPQKGHFTTNKQGHKISWEIATAGSTAGEQVKLKMLIKEEITPLTKLGLSKDQYAKLESMQNVNNGVFLVTGPKKSGVTTTFYALLKNHDAFINSVETLEKNPTADLPNIQQHTFSLSDTGTTTFARKLLTLIRTAPDIIGVAGIEKNEGAQVCCRAEKEGVLLYVTLEAKTLMEALEKWVRLVKDKNLALDCLAGITCQTLIRKLCDECKQAYTPKKEIIQKFNLPADKAKVLYRPGKVIYDKHGKEMECDNCNGIGYFGRIGVYETVIVDQQLRDQLKKAKSFSEINSLLRKTKLRTLKEQILTKVLDGQTAINEMIRVLSNIASEGRRPVRKPPAPKKP